MSSIFKVRRKDNKNGNPELSFSSRELVRKYLDSVTSFYDEYEVEEIPIDSKIDDYNPLRGFKVVVDDVGEVQCILSSSVSRCLKNTIGKSRIRSKNKNNNHYVHVIAENEEQASIKAIEVRDHMIMNGIWPG